MKRSGIHLLGTILLVAAVAAIGLDSASALAEHEAETGPISLQSLDQEDEGFLPCAPQWNRTYEPMAVKQGDTVRVTVWYDFNCSRETERVNIMLVVNDSVENDFNERQGLERSMRTALQEFVSQVNFRSGSALGLVLYNSRALTRSPLRADVQQRQVLLDLLETFRIGFGSALAMDTAIGQAWKQLPTQVSEEVDRNWMVIFDAGAQPGSPGGWCTQAKRTGVKIVGVQVPAGQGRLVGCVNSGLLTASDNQGTNLPDLFKAVAEAIVKGDAVQEVILTEYVNKSYATYVKGSASRPPDNNFNDEDFDWSFDASTHPRGGAGNALSYDMRIREDEPLAPDIVKISHDSPEIMFKYAASAGLQRRDLQNPELCIYRDGKPEDCSAHLTAVAPTEVPTLIPTATITPTMGAETATPIPPTVTNTPDAPTPTDEPDTPEPDTPTPETPEGCDNCIFMPMLSPEQR